MPEDALGYWTHRLVAHGVTHQAPERRFDAAVLPSTDPDGTRLALVAIPGIEGEPAWRRSEVPAEHAIRGFHGVTLLLDVAAPTGAILTDVLGFAEVAREGNVTRFTVEGTGPGEHVDLRAAGSFLPGRPGGGSVHHIAFRASSDAAQAAMVAKLAGHGIQATEPRDRNYFRSVYFREPGGVLFEIATDDPGFAVDEPVASLGQELKLPRFLEGGRAQIEAALPALA